MIRQHDSAAWPALQLTNKGTSDIIKSKKIAMRRVPPARDPRPPVVMKPSGSSSAAKNNSPPAKKTPPAAQDVAGRKKRASTDLDSLGDASRVLVSQLSSPPGSKPRKL